MTQFLRIVQWDRHQHYKDRNPPWIKLHRDLLTSETWVSSSNENRVLAVACMLLAAASGNRIPANPRYIQRVAYLDFIPDLSALIEVGFLEYVEDQQLNGNASSALAPARPETETETEKDTIEASASIGADAPKGPSAVDLRAAVFDSGVPLLTSTGSTERNARSYLGRKRQDYGDAAVLDALAEATAKAISDPIPWMNRYLEARNGQRSIPGHRTSHSLSAWIDEDERPQTH